MELNDGDVVDEGLQESLSFITDIRHVSGESNVVADMLSRPALPVHVSLALVQEQLVGAISLCLGLVLAALAGDQFPGEFSVISSSSLRVQRLKLPPPDAGFILFNISQDRPCTLVPAA